MRILEVISNLHPVGGGETFAVNFSRCAQDLSTLKTVILYKKHTEMFIERLKEKNVDFIFLNKQNSPLYYTQIFIFLKARETYHIVNKKVSTCERRKCYVNAYLYVFNDRYIRKTLRSCF